MRCSVEGRRFDGGGRPRQEGPQFVASPSTLCWANFLEWAAAPSSRIISPRRMRGSTVGTSGVAQVKLK